MIKRRQILGRAATARDDNYFDLTHPIEILQPGRDLDGSRLPLHLRGINQHTRRMMTPRQNIENVAHRRALRRSDDSDTERQWRDRFLSRSIEQSLRIKTRLELLKGQLQSTPALRLHELRRYLQLAPILIH